MNRLLQKIDNLLENKILNEEVYAQIGFSDYAPKHFKYKDFLDAKQYNEYIKKCRLLICHGGVGTIISGLKNNKPIIVVPRLAKFNEHVDDHQVEIARAFSETNYVLTCFANDDLAEKIKDAENYKFRKYTSENSGIIEEIINFIDNI